MLLHKIHGHRERILSLQSTLIKTTGTIRSVGHWSRKSTYLQAIVQVLIYIGVCVCVRPVWHLSGSCEILHSFRQSFCSFFPVDIRQPSSEQS